MSMRHRRVLLNLCVVALLPALSGCGLLFGGTTQIIRATSSPDGVTVSAGMGGQDYKTPASISLERKNNYTLTFSAQGYSSQKVDLQRSIRGGIVVLDILCGLVPVIVDAATGAWYKLSPEVVNVSLAKLDAGMPGPDVIDLSIGVESDADSIRVSVGTTPSVDVSIHVETR